MFENLFISEEDFLGKVVSIRHLYLIFSKSNTEPIDQYNHHLEILNIKFNKAIHFHHGGKVS